MQVAVPQHRMTPLKTHWMELYKPITENLKLDMRMNLKTKKGESRRPEHATAFQAQLPRGGLCASRFCCLETQGRKAGEVGIRAHGAA